MSKLAIYDPAMCCSSGVCGPSVDSELLRISAVVEKLKQAGIEVERHNLSSDPQAFMSSEAVNNALSKKGVNALPITMIDGKIVKSGAYPTDMELSRWLDISVGQSASSQPTKVKVKKSCCGPKGCC